jgi:hypothetical protein
MKRLKWACSILAIGALALPAALLPANAAPVTFAFVAPVTSGAFSGLVGSGSISFDNSFVGTLTPANSDLAISFTFLGQTFDQTFDPDFPDFPEVIVLGGVPVSIDFLLTQGAAGVDFDDPAIGAIALQGALLPGSGATLVASIDITGPDASQVPEPSSFGLAGLALTGLVWRWQRSRRPASTQLPLKAQP